MTQMPKTRATSIEDRLDALDPAGPARDAAELRAIHDIAEAIATNEQRLRDAVVSARAAGYSWGKIAVSLGVTAQAAHKRFAGIS
jgi:DNA-directed RNA polymerase specialized sigma24 family protein